MKLLLGSGATALGSVTTSANSKLTHSPEDRGVNFKKEPLYFAIYERADLRACADHRSR